MWRLIFIGFIIWLVIYIFKRNANQHRTTKSSDKKVNTPENIEDMVQCTNCAVHLPRSEAFLVNGNFYCSRAHIQQK